MRWWIKAPRSFPPIVVTMSWTVAPGVMSTLIGTMFESIEGVDLASLPRRAVTGNARDTCCSPVILCRYMDAAVRSNAGAVPDADSSASTAAGERLRAERSSESAVPMGRPANPAGTG